MIFGGANVENAMNGKAAIFSDDMRYRYFLSRQVSLMTSEGVCTFLMLNPSTADDVVNDPTIRRCIGFASGWGYGWLQVVNLSPLRATLPSDLFKAGNDPVDVWDRNISCILDAAECSDLLVAAYGTHGTRHDRDKRVLDAVAKAGHDVHCLGVTKQGQPKHPMYLRGDLVPEIFRSNSGKNGNLFS